MHLFLALFGRWLRFDYHCFDRVVINGYLRFLFQEGCVITFFHHICGVARITKEVLRARSDDYNRWVAAYAANHGVPLVWATPGERKEEVVHPFLRLRKRAGRFGLYYVMMSQERGPSFRIAPPKYPTADPDHMILRAQRSRYRHYYFYIYDEVLGAMLLRVGSFVPFAVTAYINGHEFIARRMQKQAIAYCQPENCFTVVGDRAALQKAADAFSAQVIQERIDYWSFHLGPKFSQKERVACGGLRRFWSLQQIEYCHNFVFKRNRPIRRLFERACELSLYLLSADRIGQIFAQPVRRRVRGKLQSVLERIEGGMHVYRAYWKHSFLKAYEKCRTFLRLEIVCNNLEDFGLKKQLCHLSAVKEKFAQILDRFAQTKAEHLNVHGHLDLIAEMARPVSKGNGKVAGLKLENTRLMRLLEVLLRRAGGGFGGWRTEQLRAAILDGFGLQAHQYSPNQIRYDLRKLAAHGIIERLERSYSYALSARGQKTAILLTLFARRIYGPLCSSLLDHRPNRAHRPASPFEKAYQKVDASMDELLLALAA